MKKAFIGLVSVLLGVMIQAPSVTAGTLVEFEGGIGVIPVSSCTPAAPAACTTPVRNDIRGVAPGGQPWVIRRLEAKVKDNGDIRAEGKGLLLAGGNSIGTTGGLPTVFATLFCGSDVSHNSGVHPLAADGDFKIKDTLSPPPPTPCTSPVLLIRVAAGRWIAAGIPKVKEEDD